MLARSARNAAPPTSSSGVASARSAVAATTGFERREHALAVGLAERDEAHAGGNEVGRLSVQIGMQRRRERSRCPAQATPTATGSATGPSQTASSRVERRARPGRARGLEEGAALRGGLQVALLRRREGGGELGDRAQRRVVAGGAARWAWTKNTASQNPPPSPIITASQRRSVVGVRDVAGLDRPFDPARIGERADRIGRRQPRHQPVERCAARAVPAA